MNINIKIDDEVQYYFVKVVNGKIVRMTEVKPAKRDRYGRFRGDPRKRPAGGYCRWYGACPFTTKGR